MQDLLIASTIKLTAFPTLVQRWKTPAEEQTLMWLEAMPRQKIQPNERQDLLRFELFQPDFDYARYRSGRLFHEYGELHWEEMNSDEVQLIYTGEPEYRPEIPEHHKRTLSDETYVRVPRHYFLFGKRLNENERGRIGRVAQAGDFAEVRIPRLLRYPCLPDLEGAERIQLAAYEYVDLATGASTAYRFHALVPFRPQREGNTEREEKTLA